LAIAAKVYLSKTFISDNGKQYFFYFETKSQRYFVIIYIISWKMVNSQIRFFATLKRGIKP